MLPQFFNLDSVYINKNDNSWNKILKVKNQIYQIKYFMVSNCFLGIVPAIIIFSSVYDQ